MQSSPSLKPRAPSGGRRAPSHSAQRLSLSKPFLGVGGGASHSLGQIFLPVTFGTRDNYRTELVDFDIARVDPPYDAILEYPALAQFMAATHPAYNLMKMPGSKGVLTIKGTPRRL